MDEHDVLIVGAGPTGLTLACDLRSRGIAVQIIDEATRPATSSRALGLQPRGREILARLNALGDLPERAVHAYATNIRSGRRLLTKFVVQTERGQDVLGPLPISQAEVEAQLRRRLAELGGEVAWDHALVGSIQGREGWPHRLAILAIRDRRAGGLGPSLARPERCGPFNTEGPAR
jgi:4,5-epoxidase